MTLKAETKPDCSCMRVHMWREDKSSWKEIAFSLVISIFFRASERIVIASIESRRTKSSHNSTISLFAVYCCGLNCLQTAFISFSLAQIEWKESNVRWIEKFQFIFIMEINFTFHQDSPLRAVLGSAIWIFKSPRLDDEKYFSILLKIWSRFVSFSLFALRKQSY